MLKMKKIIQDLKTELNKEIETLKRTLDGIEKLNNSTKKLNGKLYN